MNQFKKDKLQVMVSLQLRPRNWIRSKHYGKIFAVQNYSENMVVWLANGLYGLEFSIGGRRYGDVTAFSAFLNRFWAIEALSWRLRMYRAAMKTATCPYIVKSKHED